MEIDILTLFPGMFWGALSESILGRAQENGILTVRVHDIRDFTTDKHRVVDDYPFGGGRGMVMKPEPVAAAIEHALSVASVRDRGRSRVILTTPQGRKLDQSIARELAGYGHLVIVCGHYEGIDERISALIDDEISIGDYVLTGGELPAMVIVDSVARMVPGVLGDELSATEDSFYESILEHPHYTRPRQWRGSAVPEVLLSGDHEKIRVYRRKESLRRTLRRRPDLIDKADLSKEDQLLLAEIRAEDTRPS